MSDLLISEPPLQVLPSLAEMIGLNEAIFLQQLHYWRQRSKNVSPDEGGTERRWVYKTLEEWTNEMSFWSKSTIRRTADSLAEKGLIIREKKRSHEGDQTTWYAINDEALDGLVEKDTPPSVQDEHPTCSERTGDLFKMNSSGGVQDEQLRSAHNARAHTENTRDYNNKYSVCEDGENEDGKSESSVPESTGGDQLPANFEKPSVDEIDFESFTTPPPGSKSEQRERQSPNGSAAAETEEDLPIRENDPNAVRAWVEVVGDRPSIGQVEKMKSIFTGHRSPAWDEYTFKETLDNALLSCDGEAFRIDFGRLRDDYKRNLRKSDHAAPENGGGRRS